LSRRYSSFKRELSGDTQWTDHYVLKEIDLRNFRSDNAFLYQVRDGNTVTGYALTAFYLGTIDRFSLMAKLHEDGCFGAHVVDFNGQCLVSRDLLDSIFEIYFLDQVFDLSSRLHFTILDIGAGYGRLAHRITTAFPGKVKMLLTDAIATSTFLSEFYMRFRGCDRQATVVPLDEIQAALKTVPVDLATNIHSFSECPLSWVCWWLDRLKENRVRYLLIVPNTGGLTTREKGRKRLDYSGELERRGFELVVERPKYESPIVQSYGVSPACYRLFRLSD
jgi:hypothetical protein